MKKILNGKVYDTDTARCVGAWSSSDDPRAFQYVEETLFRKKNGEFFLHGFGGPASVYRVATSENSWQSGERIIPLAYDQAAQWAENHITAEQYEAAFGPIQEDGSRINAHISISAGVWDAAKREASRRGMNVSELTEELLKAYISQQNG